MNIQSWISLRNRLLIILFIYTFIFPIPKHEYTQDLMGNILNINFEMSRVEDFLFIYNLSLIF